jgi:hypothetical protein
MYQLTPGRSAQIVGVAANEYETSRFGARPVRKR